MEKSSQERIEELESRIASMTLEINQLKHSSNAAWNELTQVVRERDKRPLPKQINLCTDCHGTGVIEWYEGEHNGWNTADCTTCWGEPDERFK